MNENAKTKLVLEYTGMDDFSCPVYKDQFGKLWKDIDLGKEPEPNLYSLSFNHIDGEPSHPIQQEYTFHPAPYQRSSYEFEIVLVEGEEVRLTATEYKILELLMEHPGQVFSSEQIYENVWQESANYTVENTVMVHIRHIREKIEIDAKKPRYVKVVWGIGYKMEKY